MRDIFSSELFSFRLMQKLRDENEFIRTVALRPFGNGGIYAFISTSTPLGKSSFESASTVLEEEV